MDPKRKVLARVDVTRGNIHGSAPFNNGAPPPTVTVRAKVSTSSISTKATGGTRIHASPLRPDSPVRSAPVSRPMSTVLGPSSVPHVRTAPNGNDASSSAPNLVFVPKAKKSAVSLVTTDNASTPSLKVPTSGANAQKSYPINGRGVLTPSNSNTRAPRTLSPAPHSQYQPRSPTPTGRLREGPRQRVGSTSGDSRISHLSHGLNVPTVDGVDSHLDKPKYNSVRRGSGASTASNRSLLRNGNHPPARLHAKVSNISVPPSTPVTPQRSPDRPYSTSSSPPLIPTTSITKPSPTMYTRSDSTLNDNSTSPRRRVSLSSPSSVSDTPLRHRRTSSGVRTPASGAGLSPFITTRMPLNVHGEANNSKSSVTVTPSNFRAAEWQSEPTRAMTGKFDATVPRSPVSSTFSSGSLASGGKHSNSQSGQSLNLFPPSHSRSGSEVSSSVSSSMSSGRTTSMINGAPVRASRSDIFSISRRHDEIDREVNHELGMPRTEGVRAPVDGIYTSGDFEVDKAKSEAKSSRKIADLEITNKSLLAINAMLEADKHRLSKEIRYLRRRLREQRLSLPPQTYRALVRHEQRAAALSPPAPGEHPLSTEALPLAAGQTNIFADEDEDLDDDEAVFEQPDPAYERVTALMDALLFHATEALSSSAFDGDTHLSPHSAGGRAPSPNLGLKVLSPAEVEEHYELKRRNVLELDDDNASVDGSLDSIPSMGEDAVLDPALVPLPDTAELTDSSFS